MVGFSFCPLLAPRLAAQDDVLPVRLDAEFTDPIRPLVARYCNECHTGETAEAEVDLSVFETSDDVHREIPIWLRVREMLDTRQMPPPDARQPSDDERSRLRRWVQDFLTAEAAARAGDPGPVVLRRLSNDEYTYSIRDLTRIDSLDPAHEFPIDGAAGEGFTNVGGGLVMSPSLVGKFLDAAKEVADHAVLLPDGIRFSEHTTRRDWTNEWLARIQAFYARFTDEGGGSAVDLQGIRFDTNRGGRLPLQRYLAATLEARDALSSGRVTLAEVAQLRGLNARYLTTLWHELTRQDAAADSSLLLDAVRERWRDAGPGDAAALTAEIAAWQQELWKFNPVGHIGRDGGPTAWMEAVTPLVDRRDFRVKLPAAASGAAASGVAESENILSIYLSANDAGDGHAEDFVVWQRPRLEIAGRSPILLSDLPSVARSAQQASTSELARTVDYLAAVAELHATSRTLVEVAAARQLQPRVLESWTAYVDLGRRVTPEITGRFTNRVQAAHGYADINGWGNGATPSLLTNRSDQPISFLTLTVPARGVVVHPSPTQEAAAVWRSPVNARLSVRGLIADADDKCGNGAAWRVELLSHAGRSTLVEGTLDNGRQLRFAPKTEFTVEVGDVLRLVVGARDNNHVCDTTHIEWTISEVGGEKRTWDLAADVVDRILEGNPLADAYGNADAWHFCVAEPDAATTVSIPPGSALSEWRQAVTADRPQAEIGERAQAVRRVLTETDAASLTPPDASCRAQLEDWRGPFDWIELVRTNDLSASAGAPELTAIGLAADRFGRHPTGAAIDAASVCVQAPMVLEVRLPARLAADSEFVVGGTLHAGTARKGAVQLQVALQRPEAQGLAAGGPVIAARDGLAMPRWQAAMDAFRDLFPPTLCYARIVPVDEVVTLARVLASPHFLYRREQPPPGAGIAPVSNDELATRLSYFLWSSLPDEQLRATAADQRLTDDQQLIVETRRLLADQRTRRLAIQFACQWLHIRNFDQHDQKNEQLFPEFADLRGPMYEESVRFFEDLFRNNGSVLEILNADHTFLNEALARHYGVDGAQGDGWRRVDGVRLQGRGGVLAMATVLASQSGASRTSPILRGNWVSETLLGERLPRPPANVPQLPEAVPTGLTARQLIELHTASPECAKCHARIDPFGFAIEQYDVLGRFRPEPADTRTTLLDGQEFTGLDGLRDYLLTVRRDDFLRQFCRKLLGYALGREVQLSDEPLLDELGKRLAEHDYRFHTAVETIVTSRQFRGIRGDAFVSL